MTRTQEHTAPNIDRQTKDKRTANVLRFFVPSLARRLAQALLLLLLLAPLPTCLPDSFAQIEPAPKGPKPSIFQVEPDHSEPEGGGTVILTGNNFLVDDNDTCMVQFWDKPIHGGSLLPRLEAGLQKLEFQLPSSPHSASALDLIGQNVPITVSCNGRKSEPQKDKFSYIRKPQQLLANAQAENPALIRVEDIDNDKKQDLVVTTANNKCRIFTLKGRNDGSFEDDRTCKFGPPVYTLENVTVLALDVGLLDGDLKNQKDIIAIVRQSNGAHYIDYLFNNIMPDYQSFGMQEKIYSAFLSGSTLNIAKSASSSSALEKRPWQGWPQKYGVVNPVKPVDSPVTYYTKCGPQMVPGAIFGAAVQQDKIGFVDYELNNLSMTGIAATNPHRILCTSLDVLGGSQAVIPFGNPISSFLISDLSSRPMKTDEYKMARNITPGTYISIKAGDLDGDGKNDLAVVSDSEHGQVFLLQSHNQWQLETVETGLGVHRDVEVADLNGDRLADVVLPGTDSDGKGGVFVYLSYRP